MSQQSIHHSFSSYPVSMNQNNFKQQGLQTPLKKQASKSQRDDNEQDQETMQKFNLPNSQSSCAYEQNQTIKHRLQKKLVLYDDDKHRYFFPLFKDKQVGIPSKFSKLVINSWNDDDKQTSGSQLQRGKDQTMSDLYDYLAPTYGKNNALSREQLQKISKKTC